MTLGFDPADAALVFSVFMLGGLVKGVAGFGLPTLGLGLLVFVEVSLDKTTSDVFDDFARAVRLTPEILECHMVAGGFDYLVKARVADMAAYRRLLGDVLLALPGVKETRSSFVLATLKPPGVVPV